MIGDRRKMKPPDPSVCLELSSVTSMLLTKPCFYLWVLSPPLLHLQLMCHSLGGSGDSQGQSGLTRLLVLSASHQRGYMPCPASVCLESALRRHKVPWEAGKDWKKGQKHRFSFEQIHWDSKRTAVTVSLKFY